jgi:hydroxymethylpyrimidine/phosphomethylpyrimidine kinase
VSPPEATSSRSRAGRASPAVLVIAATDSSGGAGLTRDVRVLTELSVDALCAVTAVTAQSDQRVSAVHHVPPDIIRQQIAAAFATRDIAAVKIGMLGTATTVEAVVSELAATLGPGRTVAPAIAIVVDPVLVSSSGGVLLDMAGRAALLEKLLPCATLVTPNVPEAAALLGEPVATGEEGLIEQGRRLLTRGTGAVLIKGGHADGAEAVDLLIRAPEGALERFPSQRLSGTRRGTGCALASAIAAGLAHGKSLSEACRHAKQYVMRMLGSEVTGVGHE